MSLKNKFVILFLTLSYFSFSQTNVSGIINSNTTWSLANSPYTITGSVLINTGIKLTIEPGVLIKVNSGLGLQNRGEIIAVGTANARITFTSSSATPAAGNWFGISYSDQSVDPVYDNSGNYLSGSILKYVDILYAGALNGAGAFSSSNAGFLLDNVIIKYGRDKGIECALGNSKGKLLNSEVSNHSEWGILSTQGGNGSIEIDNCKIVNNSGAMRHNGNSVTLTNSILKDNGNIGLQLLMLTVNGTTNPRIIGNKFINHTWYSLQLNNIGGPHVSSIISKNIFINNLRAISLQEAGARVDSNIFVHNNSVLIYGKALKMRHNHIYKTNQTNQWSSPPLWSDASIVAVDNVGASESLEFNHNMVAENISLDSSLIMIGYPFSAIFEINKNNFLSNKSGKIIWNTLSSSGQNVDAENNYWGTTNTSQIANMVHDWFNDVTLSFINTAPILSVPDTTAPISPPKFLTKGINSSGFVNLRWLANPEADVAGYKIYFGNPTGYSYDSVVDVGNVLSYTLSGITNLSAEYAVVAYDNLANGTGSNLVDGHQSWFAISEQFSPTISTSNFNGNNVSCNGGANGQIIITISDGTAPYYYSWSHDSSLSSNVATNLTAGTYQFSVADSDGLIITDSLVLNEPDSLSFVVSKTDILCAGVNDGQISFTTTGGTAPFQFSINGGASYSFNSTFSGLASGIYTLSVLDANNCTSNTTDTLFQIGSLSLVLDSSKHLTCNGSNDGSIWVTAAGGVLPYSYVWSNGDTIDDISSLPAGQYNLTVTDANGCFQSLSHTTTEPNILTTNPAVSNFNGYEISCNGSADGSIVLNALGGTFPYSYSWAHDANLISGSISNLGTGTYIYTITDDHLCWFTDTIVITQPDSLLIQSVQLYSNNCSNGADGNIAVHVIGGTLPYSFSLLDSLGNMVSNSDSTGNLTPGTYSFSVSDANSCFASVQNIQLAFIHTPIKPFITALDSVICSGAITTLSLNLGIQSAVWNDGFSGLVRNLPSGSYWASTSDTNGCLGFSDSIVIKDLVAEDTSAQICLVTYDSGLDKNRIIFHKPSNENGISTYNIYKDVVGVWQNIGTVNSGDSSQYIDFTSQPSSKVARYYVETEDLCGTTYSVPNSSIHKTILLQSSIGTNGEINLLWNHYEGATIDYYRILRKNTNGSFIALDSVGISFNSYIDNNPPIGISTYFIDAVLTSTCSVKAKNKNYSSISTNSVSENTVGLNENIAAYFNIYPNPTNDFLNIEHEIGGGKKEIRLYDSKGKLIEWIDSDEDSLLIDLSELPNGIYHLKIITNSGVVSQLIIRS